MDQRSSSATISLTMSRKTRDLRAVIGRGRLTQLNRGPGTIPLKPGVSPKVVTTKVDERVVGNQVTDSEKHVFRRLNAAAGDIGGPFYSRKTTISTQPRRVTWFTPWVGRDFNWDQMWSFTGDVLPCSPFAFPSPPSSDSTDAQLNSLGATAVKLAKPTNSGANLAVSLGELKDGFATFGFRAWEKISDHARRAGGDYLAIQFGYRPLISEVMSFTDSVIRSAALIKQLERDAGRVVRRRFEFPLEESTVRSVLTSQPPYWVSDGPANSGIIGSGSIIRLRETSVRRWFSGAFTYFLPAGYYNLSGFKKFEAQANLLVGTELTPDVLWELAPWSWAIDWFSNVGDVISNITDFSDQGLVMRYGYLMEHSIIKDTYTREVPACYTFTGGNLVDVTSSFSRITETKKRVRANPFGFGVSWEGLSPFQLSIAAALGISKGPRA